MKIRWMVAWAGMALLQGAVAGEVTLRGLMAEMADYSSLARWPEPVFVLKNASSHDQRTVAPDQPGWFANDDFSQYLRTEVRDGRQERVMMEDDGPGCIVRFWLTTVKNKRGTLRVYLDGAEQPALTFPAFDLMAGDDLHLKEPLLLAHPGYNATDNGGNTLMLPLPYAKHCKVTWEEQGEGPRYYQIDYRSYPQGTRVETFSKAVLQRARADVAKTGEALAKPEAGRLPNTTVMLYAGKSLAVELPPGPAAVREMMLKLPPGRGAEHERALRSVIVKMNFDGEETVWCPATDFFGSGVGTNELKSFYREVAKDGTMICRWVMPYREKAVVELLNTGERELTAQMLISTRAWTWDARSMHFHANWHYEAGLTTPPARDWNYATLTGRGVYAGDTLALFNQKPTWYGEGDEKIRVDGNWSDLGTGTEDYYNYSFAPRGIMQTPFANQVRVDEPRTQGHNVQTRTRNLDGIAFRQSLDFETELISWAPTRLIYAATTYWYGLPGATSNIVANPAGATAVIPTLADAQAPPPSFPGMLEAENLKVSATSPGLAHEVQDMDAFGVGVWSGGKQLLGRATKEGEFVTLQIPAPDAAEHELWLSATQAPDYGTLAFSVNGKAATANFDGYAPSVKRGEDASLGSFTPVDGRFEVTIRVSGANPAANGARYFFGLDGFRVK